MVGDLKRRGDLLPWITFIDQHAKHDVGGGGILLNFQRFFRARIYVLGTYLRLCLRAFGVIFRKIANICSALTWRISINK